MKNIKIAILCGGRGRRLNSLTSELPKPLISLRGKPILEHVLNFFERKGYNDFVLCVGYKGNKIVEFVERYKKGRNCNIHLSDEGECSSILQRIYALKDMTDERILVTYGDTLTDLNMKEYIDRHEKSGALITMTTSKIKSPFGFVEIGDNGMATAFVEKPIFNYYIGHVIMDPDVMRYITNDMLRQPDGAGLVDLFSKMIAMGSLNVYEHHGAQITFNTEIQLAKAEEDIIDFYSQREDNNESKK